MDGFEDNTGVVVTAATNRPTALDSALTLPGRFDRIISMPLLNLEGRKEIFGVHARGKQMEEADFERISRATAGFTGADIMNLMNQAAVITVRAGRKAITEDDTFTALEHVQAEKLGYSGDSTASDEVLAPPQMRRSIAVYKAGRALIGSITPDYDEISKVVACPGGVATGHTYFIPSEEHLESGITTRGFMEARMVVSLAGRCAERLLLGDENVSTSGGTDLEVANNIAREMVYRCGFSSKLGHVSLMDREEVFLGRERTRAVGQVSTELARIAQAECQDLLQAAEAKAYYGLARNYRALEALVAALERREILSGDELREVLGREGVVPFETFFTAGFGYDGETGQVTFPGQPEVSQAEGNGSNGSNGAGWGRTGRCWFKVPYLGVDTAVQVAPITNSANP